jgi:hypothetical protein
MSSAPEIREEYIAAAAVQIVLKRLLESGQLNTREVYWRLKHANPNAEPHLLALLFNSKLQEIGLAYLTLRN